MTEPTRRPAPIVKLGGSLFGASTLGTLLDVAARHGALVVAGGGPFADCVRSAQREHEFDDRAAHRMAILAMEQAACLLLSKRPTFALCGGPDQIAAAAASGRPAIWSPSAMALAADVPASWDVTSDSLALWLAIRTGAPCVVLVKSAAVPGHDNAEAWAAAGLVDRYFPTLAGRFDGDLRCVGEGSAAALDQGLAALRRVAA